jgi:cysteine desulfurase
VEILYLDHAATAPPLPEALDAFLAASQTNFANPGSLHGLGASAGRLLEQARGDLQRALGARDYQVIWTATGTEGNHLGVQGLARRLRPAAERAAKTHPTTARAQAAPRILLGAIEHPSSMQAGLALQSEGYLVEIIPCDPQGIIQPEALRKLLGPDVALVSVHWANNELGSLSPIAELVRLTRQLAPNAAFHVDAVQAAGKRPESIDSLGADSVAIAAHKLGGLRGCAALLLRKGGPVPQPLFIGGGHEQGLRSGTENVMGAAAFAAAASQRRARLRANPRCYLDRHAQLLALLREVVPDLVVAGPSTDADRHSSQESQILGSILSVAFPHTRAETMLHLLEAQGIVCGSGSACSAHGHTESAILKAIQFPPELCNSVLRFSMDGSESRQDFVRVADALKSALAQFQKI